MFDPDLKSAVLASIDDWVDAGSKDLYIYDKVHAHGPPDMGRRFWGHLPLSWMHQKMLGAKLYYTLFDNEEARNDEDRLWVLVLRDARRCSAATATSMDVIAVATAYLESATFYND